MKEVFFGHDELQVALALRDLTRQTHSSYAGSMADQEEKKDKSSTEVQKNSETKQNQAQQTEAKMWLDVVVSEVKNKEGKNKLKDLEVKELEGEYKKIGDAIKKVKEAFPKKEAKSYTSEARKLQRRLRNYLLFRRIFDLKKGDEKKQPPEMLKKQWYRRFTDKELEEEQTQKTIERAVKLGYSPKQEDDEELKENTKLSEEERYDRAEELLSEIQDKEIELTEEQKKAIKKAHEVGKGEKGKDGEDVAVFNYTPEQIVKKGMILAHAGFSKDEINALIANGIAGDGDAGGTTEGGNPDPNDRGPSFSTEGAPVGQDPNLSGTNPEEVNPPQSTTAVPSEEEGVPTPERYLNMTIDQLNSTSIRSAQDVNAYKNRIKELVTKNEILIDDPRLQQARARLGIAQDVYVDELHALQYQEAAAGEPSAAYNKADEAILRGPFQNRINELAKRIENEATDSNARLRYYRMMKRFVNTILDNVVDEANPQDPNRQLHLDRETVNFLQSISDEKTEELVKPNDDSALVERAKKLTGRTDIAPGKKMELQSYFGNLSERREVKSSRYLPNSIDEVCNLIEQNYGTDFSTGNKYELFNEDNEFQVQNFLAWLRLRLYDLDDGNPNAEIDGLGGVTLQTEMSRISLLDIILIPKYTSTQKVRLANSKEGEAVSASYGPLEEHPDLRDGKWIFLREAWMFALNHNYDAAYRKIRGKEDDVPKALGEMFRNSDFTGDARLLKLFKLSETNLEAFREYRDNEAEGEVGKAMRQIVLSYNYLAHLTDNENLDYDKNMFYKVMGKEGMSAFYESLASDALSTKQENKESYRQYVLWMLNDEKAKHPEYSKQIDAKIKEVREMGLHETTQQAVVKGATFYKKAELNIRLDYMKEVEDVYMSIATHEKNRKLTKEEEEEVRNNIKKRVSETVYDHFLKDLNGKFFAEDEKKNKVDVMSYYGKNDREFAFGLIKNLMHAEKGELNFFSLKTPNEAVEKMMRKAINNGVCRQRKLTDDDATYAGMWAWRFRNWTGIAARNDTNAVGFDAWSKIMNLKDYRIRGENGRVLAGNRHTIPGIKRMSLTFWEGMRVKTEDGNTVRMIDILQGNDGSDSSQVDLKQGIGRGTFNLGVMADFADTHIGKAMDLFKEITEESYMNLDQIVSVDPTGRIMIDDVKLFKLQDTWYKNIRYTFDQLGFDYDKEINVWERVNKTDKFGRVIKDKNGVAQTKLVFRNLKLREYFFDHEVNDMGMYERFGIKPGDEKRMSRNIWAYLISKEIGHHIETGRIHHAWTIDQLRLIQQAFAYLAQDVNREDHDGHEHIKVANAFYSKKEFNKILKHAGIKDVSIGDFQLLSPFAFMETKEAGKSFGAAGASGLFAMIGAALKQAGPGSGGGGGGGGGGGHGGGGGGHGGGHH